MLMLAVRTSPYIKSRTIYITPHDDIEVQRFPCNEDTIYKFSKIKDDERIFYCDVLVGELGLSGT